MRWAIGFVVLALLGGTTWAVVTQNRWETRCHRAGGHVEHRPDGMTIVIVGKVPVPTQRYTEHCWIDGREVSV